MSRAGNKKRAGKHVSHAKKATDKQRRPRPDDDYDLRDEARDDEPDWREEEFAARWTVGADGAGEENEA